MEFKRGNRKIDIFLVKDFADLKKLFGLEREESRLCDFQCIREMIKCSWKKKEKEKLNML